MPGQESAFHSEGTGEPLKASEQRGEIKVNLYMRFCIMIPMLLGTLQTNGVFQMVLGSPTGPSFTPAGWSPDSAVSGPCRRCQL